MAFLAPGVSYEEDLEEIRTRYVGSSPRQRLGIIRQRLNDHHFGPNRLVTAVSAVEALARSLLMHSVASKKADLLERYPNFRYRKPEGLIREFLESRGIADPKAFFAEDTWQLFGYAVKYRNLLAHECTYLGLVKFPSLIQACDDVLTALTKIGRVREPRT
jgi:hypothetical protein